MTRRGKDKASLVEFLSSIKFAQQKPAVANSGCSKHFAHFYQHARVSTTEPGEEKKHVRSAN